MRCDLCGSDNAIDDPENTRLDNKSLCLDCGETTGYRLIENFTAVCSHPDCDKEWKVVGGRPIDPDGDYGTHYKGVHGG